MGFKVVTGYYRYTDIWFHWPQTCGKDEGPLKAILAHDALVSNDHPLHVDKVDGAQLFVGTLPSGESRLLFSSKQVDYLRYWLHAVGLTKEIIPLPYSDCLLRERDLKGITTKIYKTGGDLRGAIKKIEKANKGIKKSTDPPLTFRRKTFEQVRTLYQAKVGVWCAVDFEAWERDHTMITEFGWSRIQWQDGKEVLDDGHLVVKEYKAYTNGTYVPDNRQNYRFGTSQVVSKKDFKSRIHDLLAELKHHAHVFLVFHGADSDIKYFKSAMVEVDLTGISYTLPNDSSSADGIFVVDTEDLFGGLQGEGKRSRGLEQMCHHLGIEPMCLHNAGNDAHYTLAACKEMASGDSIDLQRDERWPGKTDVGTVKVDIDALENNEGDDDEVYNSTEDMYKSLLG